MSKLKGTILDPLQSISSDAATLEQTAATLVASGLSVIPIRSDKSKAPSVPWKTYQNRRATPSELHYWYGGGLLLGIAVVGGKVSGGLEIIDFDLPELFEPWQALVEEANADLLDNLPVTLTPSGGYHLFYRCREIKGNQKLAQRKGENGRHEVMIETRAEGGFVLIPGCPPECHAEGEYILISGSLNQIPIISKRDRSTLLDTARSFDAPTSNGALHTANPSTMTWSQILEPHGWHKGPPRNDEALNWTRPGKNRGASGTTNFGGKDLFHNFSTNGFPFEPSRYYTKHEAYTLLNHDERSDVWPDLEPLPILLPKAPALDPALLPESLSPWLLDESERMQVPLEMVAIPTLTAIGSVVGRSRTIFPKEFDDWQVTPNQWGGVVARSGLLKSPSQQRGLKPLDFNK